MYFGSTPVVRPRSDQIGVCDAVVRIPVHMQEDLTTLLRGPLTAYRNTDSWISLLSEKIPLRGVHKVINTIEILECMTKSVLDSPGVIVPLAAFVKSKWRKHTEERIGPGVVKRLESFSRFVVSISKTCPKWCLIGAKNQPNGSNTSLWAYSRTLSRLNSDSYDEQSRWVKNGEKHRVKQNYRKKDEKKVKLDGLVAMKPVGNLFPSVVHLCQHTFIKK